MSVEIDVPPEVLLKWEELGTPIVKIPSPVLRQVARPVERPTPALRELVDRMKSAMLQAHGVGLAAPQMGASQRVIVYRLPEEDQPFRVLLNPRIVSMKGEQVGPEGCLSMPLLQGEVKRANEVIVKAMDMLGRPFKRRASEFEARVIQHEVDHLDGILFTDRADPATLHWLLEDQEESAEQPTAALAD